MAAGKAKRSDKAIWQKHCHCSLVWQTKAEADEPGSGRSALIISIAPSVGRAFDFGSIISFNANGRNDAPAKISTVAKP
ncbi:hypothetical protein EHI47_26700 [Rhizobium leguminosarum]|uniref:Uncharacterized protein n=1 Tax=Rhizobium leguminosarum TaxID=384 RepID=A0A444HQS5_RHILE|nr:hypothetical protein EHI47_26700 [Rhizobium leguminosarum]